MTSEKRNRRSSNRARTSARQEEKSRTEGEDSHLACRGLDFDLVRWDELRLVLAAPFDGAFDALARVVELPFGCTHVAWDRIWLIKPAALPWRISVIVGETKRVCILKEIQSVNRRSRKSRRRKRTSRRACSFTFCPS